MLVSNQLVKEEIREEILKIPQDKQNGNVPTFVGCSQRNPKRKIHSNKCLYYALVMGI